MISRNDIVKHKRTSTLNLVDVESDANAFAIVFSEPTLVKFHLIRLGCLQLPHLLAFIIVLQMLSLGWLGGATCNEQPWM